MLMGVSVEGEDKKEIFKHASALDGKLYVRSKLMRCFYVLLRLNSNQPIDEKSFSVF